MVKVLSCGGRVYVNPKYIKVTPKKPITTMEFVTKLKEAGVLDPHLSNLAKDYRAALKA